MKRSTAVCAALVVLSASLSGCASTRMTSQANPELRNRSFHKLLVHGDFRSLEYRQLAEGRLCAKLEQDAGATCLGSSEVFFPGEEHAQEDIARRLAELEIDGVLTLQPTGSGTTSTYIPPTYKTTGRTTAMGNTVVGSSTTRTYGGYDVSKPWADYEMLLQSSSDGKVAWYATASSGGNAFTSWHDIITSATDEMVTRLLVDGVLGTRVSTPLPNGGVVVVIEEGWDQGVVLIERGGGGEVSAQAVGARPELLFVNGQLVVRGGAQAGTEVVVRIPETVKAARVEMADGSERIVNVGPQGSRVYVDPVQG